ncbi:MAG: CoA transferase [bacterium]
MANVLQDTRALDFGRVAAIAYCATLLADMGAEVIRVERPGGEFDRKMCPFAPHGGAIIYEAITPPTRSPSPWTVVVPAGRRSWTSSSENRLLSSSRFPAQGNRVMGLDYNRLKQVNAGIVLVALSGWPGGSHYGPARLRCHCAGGVWRHELLDGVYLPGLELEKIEYHHLLRTMDWLIDKKETVEKVVSKKMLSLFDGEPDLVFYERQAQGSLRGTGAAPAEGEAPRVSGSVVRKIRPRIRYNKCSNYRSSRPWHRQTPAVTQVLPVEQAVGHDAEVIP